VTRTFDAHAVAGTRIPILERHPEAPPPSCELIAFWQIGASSVAADD
jgi:hypothetical protein